MASWALPVEPLEPETEFHYDPYLEQDKTPTERMDDEMRREIEPQMEEWRPRP